MSKQTTEKIQETLHLKTTDGTPYTWSFILRDGYGVNRISAQLDGKDRTTDIGYINVSFPIERVQEILAIAAKEGVDTLTADKCAELGHRCGCHAYKIYEFVHALVRCRDDGIVRAVIQHGYLDPPPHGSTLHVKTTKDDIKGKDSPARQQTRYVDAIYYLYVRAPCHLVLDQFPKVSKRTETAFTHLTKELTSASTDITFNMGKFADTSKATRVLGLILLRDVVTTMLVQSASHNKQDITFTLGASTTTTIPFRSRLAFGLVTNRSMDEYTPSRLGTISRLCANCNKSASKKCGRCGLVVYCDQNCQRHDWPQHKPHCNTEQKRAPIEIKNVFS